MFLKNDMEEKLDKYLKMYYEDEDLTWEYYSIGMSYKVVKVTLSWGEQFITTVGITPDSEYYWWDERSVGKYDY